MNNITDYDKIVIKCVNESLSLDKNNGNINEFKSQLQNLMILHQLPQFKSETNTKLLNLVHKLYEIKNNNKQYSPILLFFYKINCNASLKFITEWKNIKNITQSKYKMFAINCENKKFADICKQLNVYQYPTIKYINNNKIIDYFGEMNSNDIIKTFNL